MKTPNSVSPIASANAKLVAPLPVAIAGPATAQVDGVTSPRVVQIPARDSASEGAIARRAYEKFIARGRVHGFDKEDWAAAQRELAGEKNRPS